MKKVVVLYGGWREDREHNFHMAQNVYCSLVKQGYPASLEEVDYANLAAQIASLCPEVVFPLAVGRYGEDGVLQAFLDSVCVPYVGSGAKACLLSTDKLMWKQTLEAHGVKTLPHTMFTALEDGHEATQKILMEVGLPVILKPAFGAFSVGVEVVQAGAEDELYHAVARSRQYCGVTIAERYIPRSDGARELQVGFIGRDTLPPSEYILSPGDTHFSLEAKQTRVYDKSNWAVPAELTAHEMATVQYLTRTIAGILDLRDYGRVDFLKIGDSFYPFDITGAPGAGEGSTFMRCAAMAGISFDDFVNRVVERARFNK